VIRLARCVDCGRQLDFREPATWTHVESGVGHAPMPEPSGRMEPETDDWTIPTPFHVAPETETERRAAWGDR
jgi:hypothetical protein